MDPCWHLPEHRPKASTADSSCPQRSDAPGVSTACTCHLPGTGPTVTLTWYTMKCSHQTLLFRVFLFVNLIWPGFQSVNEELWWYKAQLF